MRKWRLEEGVLTFLRANIGWHETRTVAKHLFGGAWQDPREMEATRQVLRRLVAKGRVWGFGDQFKEWRLRGPNDGDLASVVAVDPPALVAALTRRLCEQGFPVDQVWRGVVVLAELYEGDAP